MSCPAKDSRFIKAAIDAKSLAYNQVPNGGADISYVYLPGGIFV
jgi:hypothetical protein